MKRSGTIRKSNQLFKEKSGKTLTVYDDPAGTPVLNKNRSKSIKTSVNTSSSVIRNDPMRNKDLDSQFSNFYHPVSLQDRENMVEFVEDSDEFRRNLI